MISKLFIGLIISAVLYFLFGPGPYETFGYEELREPRDLRKYIKHQDIFKNLKTISHPNLEFPEDLFVQNGFIYSGGYQGKLYKTQPDIEMFNVVVQSQGQIMRIIKKQNLFYFLDVKIGVCLFNSETQKLDVLISSKDYGFLDSFDLSKDGKIYFTDATQKYQIDNYLHDIIEGKPNGKLFSYDIKTKVVDLLIDKLYFANGVQISPDQTAVYVAQSLRYRVWKYYLSGSRAGQKQIIIDDLPGIPDNLRFNQKGQMWIAMPQIRNWLTDIMLKGTFLRNILSKLPYNWMAKLMYGAKQTAGLKINQNGKPLQYFIGPSSVYSFITTVLQKDNTLYLGTIHHTDIGIIPL